MNYQNMIQESLPFLTHYGLIVVFIGALLEGETIVLLAGVLCHQGILAFEWSVLAAASGAFLGDQIWFHIGSYYGQNVLSRFPRLAAHADRVRPWLEHKSDLIAVGSRFVYGTRTIAPLLLGMNGYSGLRFALINGMSAVLWSLTFMGTGYLVGLGVEKLFGPIKHIEFILLLITLVMLVRWWYKNK